METRRERKEEGRMSYEEGDERARQRRARVFADAAAPQSPAQSGCARPRDRYAPGRGRGRGMRRQGPPPGQPRSSGRVGRSCSAFAGVESGDNGRSPRRKARAAGPSARPARQLSRPRHPGRQLRRDAGPALGGRAGYLKRGESFRHSSKSTVIFICLCLRLAGGAGGA